MAAADWRMVGHRRFYGKPRRQKIGERVQISRMNFGEMPEVPKVGNVRNVARATLSAYALTTFSAGVRIAVKMTHIENI